MKNTVTYYGEGTVRVAGPGFDALYQLPKADQVLQALKGKNHVREMLHAWVNTITVTSEEAVVGGKAFEPSKSIPRNHLTILLRDAGLTMYPTKFQPIFDMEEKNSLSAGKIQSLLPEFIDGLLKICKFDDSDPQVQEIRETLNRAPKDVIPAACLATNSCRVDVSGMLQCAAKAVGPTTFDHILDAVSKREDGRKLARDALEAVLVRRIDREDAHGIACRILPGTPTMSFGRAIF